MRKGYYSIKATPSQTLIITGTGITAKEVPVGNETTLNIVVQHQTTSLSEVVVTSLGIQRQSKELGYATAKINTSELTQAKVVNVATGLAGKVSGLQINLVNNGVKPDVRVTLRGNRSILGNNQALLVFDGIQLPITYLSLFNPDDVANVTVLKGASASALYGSAASNGVLIVTTRKGKPKPQITVSSTVNFESIAYLPKFQNTFGPYGGEGNANPLSANPFAGVVQIGDNPYSYMFRMKTRTTVQDIMARKFPSVHRSVCIMLTIRHIPSNRILSIIVQYRMQNLHFLIQASRPRMVLLMQ